MAGVSVNNGLVSVLAPNPSGLGCQECKVYGYQGTTMECREVPVAEGNRYMQAVLEFGTLNRAGLVGETIARRRGTTWEDSFSSGNFLLRSRGNGGMDTNNGAMCFWDPQQMSTKTWKWRRFAAPELHYIQVEGCLPSFLDTVLIPDGYSRSALVGNAGLLSDLVQMQIAKDFSSQLDSNLWFGVHGHGLTGAANPLLGQGSMLGGTLNGLMAQLYLAWQNNYYSYTERVTFDLAEWVAGKCLYIKVGDYVPAKFSFSDYGTLTDLLAGICDVLNGLYYQPGNYKRIFQATADGVSGYLYISLLDLEAPNVKVQFWLGKCKYLPNWNCDSVAGISVDTVQRGTDIKTAPTAYPFVPIGSCNGIDYLRDYLYSFMLHEFYKGPYGGKKRSLSDYVLIIDPSILMQVGLDVYNRGVEANRSNVGMGGLGNMGATISALQLPVTTLAIDTLIGTGIIMLAPRNGVTLMTEEDSGMQGSVRSGVKDASCGTVFFEQSGYAGLYLKNPGDWHGNFCGLPLFEQYKNLDIREEVPERSNCVCPPVYRTNCIETYNYNCDQLYRAVMGNSLSVEYISDPAGDSLVLNYIGSIPMDIVSFDWSVADAMGGASAGVTAGGSYTFVFTGSLEGYNLLLSMKVVTGSCPEGVTKGIRVGVSGGNMVII